MNKIKTQASNIVPQVYVIQNKYRAIFDASLQHKLVVSKIALKSSEIYILPNNNSIVRYEIASSLAIKILMPDHFTFYSLTFLSILQYNLLQYMVYVHLIITHMQYKFQILHQNFHIEGRAHKPVSEPTKQQYPKILYSIRTILYLQENVQIVRRAATLRFVVYG